MMTRKSIDTVLLSVTADKLSQRKWDWIKLMKPLDPPLGVVSGNPPKFCDVCYSHSFSLITVSVRQSSQNVAPLRGEHGSAAASTVFKIQPHLNSRAV